MESGIYRRKLKNSRVESSFKPSAKGARWHGPPPVGDNLKEVHETERAAATFRRTPPPPAKAFGAVRAPWGCRDRLKSHFMFPVLLEPQMIGHPLTDLIEDSPNGRLPTETHGVAFEIMRARIGPAHSGLDDEIEPHEGDVTRNGQA